MKATRRDFLKTAVGASALVSLTRLAPSFLCRTASAADSQGAGGKGTSLVVVQLSGGNDGLNCIVPYANDVYARSRTTLRLTASDVLRVNDDWGFHPEMKECRALFDEGLFAAVQGVGYDKSSREHPDAERDWHTAKPGDRRCQTGWIGRFADGVCDLHPGTAPAAMVSNVTRPLGLISERAIIPTLRSTADAMIKAETHAAAHSEARRLIGSAGVETLNPMLDLVRSSSLDARKATRAILDASPGSNAGYPDTRLAANLRDVATLIRAGAGFRVFYTVLGGDGFGGFDNHAFQKDHHASLLRELSGAIGAFIRDLDRDGLSSNVMLMTISEFGRTLTENGRHGTNHGAAAPLFLAGGALRGGLIGAPPDLQDLEGDAPRSQIDFRQVYATVLERWLGCDPMPIIGQRFEPLELLRAPSDAA